MHASQIALLFIIVVKSDISAIFPEFFSIFSGDFSLIPCFITAFGKARI